ncbi:MAG: hypothetical protein II978_08565 [Clostridia bacterium]|nr:hypothetical protein [Clostridia bacterium]
MINYKFKIDLEGEREICKNIVFTTGDKSGYRFEFVFYSNGKRVDTSLYGLTIKAKRADGAVIIDSGITDKDGAYYIIADNAYSVKGELEFEVALVKADGSYATTKVISASVREGFGEVGLSSSDNEPVLAKLEGQYLECRSGHNELSKEVATNTSDIKSLETQVESNTVAISENSAMISEVDERLNNQLTGLEGRIDNNDSDIQTLKDTSEEHTTSINNIIDDLATRPTAEWSEEVVNDLINKEERVSALEKLTSESLPDLDAQIQGNKASIEVLGVDMYSMGQTSKQIFANTLKGSVTGEAIALKDTSPVEHIMDVKVRKKNLLPFPYNPYYPEGVVNREISGITYSIDDKGAITFNGTATANVTIYLWSTQTLPEDMKTGKMITFSKNCSDVTQVGSVTLSCNYKDANGTSHMVIQTPSESATKTVGADWVGLTVYLHIGSGTTFTNLTIKPQIELGDKATGWSPYLAEDISTVKLSVEETDTEYAVNEDGTVDGIKSIYPNMTLLTDTIGAVIDVEYNRDINKAFAELANAIVALGGTI